MSQSPFDTYAKDLMVTPLTPHGSAQSDRRVPSDPPYADVYFEPSPEAVVATPHQGFVHRLASAGRAIFETAAMATLDAFLDANRRNDFARYVKRYLSHVEAVVGDDGGVVDAAIRRTRE